MTKRILPDIDQPMRVLALKSDSTVNDQVLKTTVATEVKAWRTWARGNVLELCAMDLSGVATVLERHCD
ncbi:MAG TPA: hypothetical protein VGY31_03990 [Terriglobia bacterium]|nr:hypothetical protein [Terriglobia bacterium]